MVTTSLIPIDAIILEICNFIVYHGSIMASEGNDKAIPEVAHQPKGFNFPKRQLGSKAS